ncbi:MAG: hypothetical protein GX889_05350 [Clostridiales bacterium]|jgi:hypothetical protein|nr:hypothetical protein [Clostridiales bacterium]
MGFAKYMEDNIEIFNNRMYKKGINIEFLLLFILVPEYNRTADNPVNFPY